MVMMVNFSGDGAGHGWDLRFLDDLLSEGGVLVKE